MKLLGYCFLVLLLSVAVSGVASAQLPPPPVNLTAHAAAQTPLGVELKWDLAKILPPVPSNFSMFKVYRSVDDSISFKYLDMTDKSAYSDRQWLRGTRIITLSRGSG